MRERAQCPRGAASCAKPHLPHAVANVGVGTAALYLAGNPPANGGHARSAGPLILPRIAIAPAAPLEKDFLVTVVVRSIVLTQRA